MNTEQNDTLRKLIPDILPPDRLVITAGIASLGKGSVKEILDKVKQFDDFNQDNDPYKQHDFGVIEHDGQKIFWKIDDYAGQQDLNLVLTIFFSHEY